MLRALARGGAHGGDTVETSRVARIAGVLGFVALALFAVGPAAVQLDLVDGFVGFRVFGLGVLLGLLALLLGVLGLVFTRASAYRAGRRQAWIGAGLGALILGITLAAAGQGGGGPAINDITTNPDDPPRFVSDPWGHGRDMAYPADFAAQQRGGYPDLAPIVVDLAPGDTHEHLIRLFERNGWTITRNDPVALTLEGTDTSKLFRFVDDIAVRVRAQGAGSVVDVRSKSRVGRGDLGANAKRIRKLRDQLKTASVSVP
jgi:uncharacterized protein (DUF1499 family)